MFSARFESYNWHVQKVDGHDREAVSYALAAAKAETSKPSLIIARTHIGYGAPNKQDTASAHGEPLGPDETKAPRNSRAGRWSRRSMFPTGSAKSSAPTWITSESDYDQWQSSLQEILRRVPGDG